VVSAGAHAWEDIMIRPPRQVGQMGGGRLSVSCCLLLLALFKDLFPFLDTRYHRSSCSRLFVVIKPDRDLSDRGSG